jgi:hypothetical protein
MDTCTHLVSRTVSVAAAMCVLTIAAGCVASASPRYPIPVEVWRGGDDGLTIKLADAISSAFRASPDFVLSNERQAGAITISIPSNVPWKQIGNRTQVLYVANFSSATSENLGTSTGACWDDELTRCADKILRDLKGSAQKLP